MLCVYLLVSLNVSALELETVLRAIMMIRACRLTPQVPRP